MSLKPAFVILAAGMGTRLGKPHPKCLTVLDNGETIMARQIRNIRAAFGEDVDIHIVVGFQVDKIVEVFPKEKYIYNAQYDQTNTSKSLLLALQHINHKKYDGIVWINGDVVFDNDLPFYLKNIVNNGQSFVSVDNKNIGEEEVKYTLDATGKIDSLSKKVLIADALGEAVGINYVTSKDALEFSYFLKHVDDQDYFEKGIEKSIQKKALEWVPFDISSLGLNAVEVDFGADLENANKTFFPA
jgi:choline kinase